MEVSCFGLKPAAIDLAGTPEQLVERLFESSQFQERHVIELPQRLWPNDRAAEFLAVAEDAMMLPPPADDDLRNACERLRDVFNVGVGRDDLGLAAASEAALFVSLAPTSARTVVAAIERIMAAGLWPGDGPHAAWLEQWQNAMAYLIDRDAFVIGHIG